MQNASEMTFMQPGTPLTTNANSAGEHDIVEVQDHFIALRVVLMHPTNFTLDVISPLSEILPRDSPAAGLDTGPLRYRATSIEVKSNVYRIFPYAEEVPANMACFIKRIAIDLEMHSFLRAIWCASVSGR
jgi:hypothetical protein